MALFGPLSVAVAWNPLPTPSEKLNFLEGIRTMTTAGDAPTQTGMAAHAYAFNADMVDDYFFNADGELLIVPETGVQADPIAYAPNVASEIESEYGRKALEGLQTIGFRFEPVA